MTDTGFYRAFEDRFRGTRELIKSRLTVYRPFIKAVLAAGGAAKAKALDLGCGRGEWLEFVTEHGYQAHGIDLDDGMLQDCRERGLNVTTADAIEFLRAQPGASLLLVSGFHLAEHIPFASLQTLIAEALRVLQPGGLLILETPNPENISVGTSSFYMDPTHKNPLPPLLLQFVPEYAGFARSMVLRLQEPQDILQREHIGLTDVLNHSSPDYAVIAQKAAPADILAPLDQLFSKVQGASTGELSARFDQQQQATLNQIHQFADIQDKMWNHLDYLTRHTAGMEAQSSQLSLKLEQLEQRSEQLALQLHATYTSTSWRITAPLRWLGHQKNLLRQHGARARARAMLRKMARVVWGIVGYTNKLAARQATIPTSEQQLTPAARKIFHQLDALVKQSGDR